MLTKEAVLETIRAGRQSKCLDGRDHVRLAKFFEEEYLDELGVSLLDGATKTVIEWNRDNIVEQLRVDVEFGFEKALGKRGISASLMNDVIKQWLWILEDPLQHNDNYTQYGLPLFKAVAIKYGFPNPIGTDRGDEDKYASD